MRRKALMIVLAVLAVALFGLLQTVTSGAEVFVFPGEVVVFNGVPAVRVGRPVVLRRFILPPPVFLVPDGALVPVIEKSVVVKRTVVPPAPAPVRVMPRVVRPRTYYYYEQPATTCGPNGCFPSGG